MTWRNHTIIFSIFYLEKKLHTIVSFKTTSKYFYLKQFSQKSIYRLIEEYNSELRFNDSYIDRRKNLITK